MGTPVGFLKPGGGKDRPSIVSRTFFSGIQRFGKVRTWDSSVDWDYLCVSVPVIWTLGLAGISFSAWVRILVFSLEFLILNFWLTDINWGPAYHALFTGHAHHDTKRWEPWLFGYNILYNYGAKHATDYLPCEDSRYDYKNATASKGGKIHKDALEERIPVFQRAGTIIPWKYHFRRNSMQIANDPYTNSARESHFSTDKKIKLGFRKLSSSANRFNSENMIYDVNSPLFRSFLSQKGGSSDKRKTEEQKPREQRPKANENKPVMNE